MLWRNFAKKRAASEPPGTIHNGLSLNVGAQMCISPANQKANAMTYRIGYFVGSLSSNSINRRLANALVNVTPQELELSEIEYAGLPLYNRDLDENYPEVARKFCSAI